MADTKLGVFTAGQGRVVPVDHKGPKSYTTNGETLGSSGGIGGTSYLGLSTLDAVIGGPANSGNYFTYGIPVGSGERQTYKLIWVTATAGVPSTTQVTSTTDLSAETVRLVVVGR